MKRTCYSAIVALTLSVAVASSAAEETATTFSYTDANAKSVDVAGEFSNWKTLPLTKNDAGVWTRTFHLKPGFYGYKFVVNGSDWVFDPANTVRKTVNDVENSGIVVGGDSVPGAPVRVSFQHKNAGAKTVHLAGEFNGWLDPDNGKVSGKAEWLMKSESDGRWTFSTMLLPGKYQYKFVINGGEVWEKDAHAPSTDEDNSLIEVKSGTTPAAAATPSAPASLAAGAAAARFTLVDSAAKSVYVAGEFNNWSATANPMKKDTFGIWGAEISLKPGKYQYKFVVDGEWRLDPNAVETAEDGDGNKNSVKVVK